MTDPQSFHDLPPPSPSWAVPIALGAAATIVVGILQAILGAFQLPCCCCGLEGLLFGALSAYIARDRDQTMTVGQGFIVAFIAVGLGSFLMALVAFFLMDDPEARRQSEEAMRKLLEDAAARDPTIQQEDIDGLVETAMRVIPFLPAVFAAVQTLFGGLGGLIGHGFAKRRNDPDPDAPVS